MTRSRKQVARPRFETAPDVVFIKELGLKSTATTTTPSKGVVATRKLLTSVTSATTSSHHQRETKTTTSVREREKIVATRWVELSTDYLNTIFAAALVDVYKNLLDVC